jgi:hypothetical protein
MAMSSPASAVAVHSSMLPFAVVQVSAPMLSATGGITGPGGTISAIPPADAVPPGPVTTTVTW